MKSIRIGLVVLLLWTISACSKNNDSTDMSLSEVLNQSEWFVHYFVNGGVDKTNEISDYTFSFNSGNALVATKSGVVPTNGTWNAFTDSGKEKLEIIWSALGTIPPILAEIEEDWVLTHKTSSLIELEDDNGSAKKIIHFRKK